jgi:hypothetical protein
MTKDEALKLALEALENIKNDPFKFDLKNGIDKAITAIKEALAQPEQEYHAVNAVHKGQQCYVKTQTEQDSGIVTAGGFDPLTQRTWVGLTDEEIAEVAVKTQDGISPRDDTLRFAIAIEAKLKEKNT